MVNFGLFWFLAHLALVLTLVVSIYRVYPKASPESKVVCAILLLFGRYILVGSLNLPFPIVFPINALSFLFFFIVAFGKISTQDRLSLPTRAAHSVAKATGE